MTILLKSILIGLWVTWAIIDEQTFQTQTTRPIITGPIVGVILGDVQTGLLVGATVELMFLATVFVGTAVPPDPTMSTAIATALAVFSGQGVEVAVATALPVALIGQIVTTVQYSVVNVLFLHRADRWAENGDTKKLTREAWMPLLMNIVFYGVPTFLAVFYGEKVVLNIISSIPETMIEGLSVGGGLIGSVGFALLLSSISDKKLWPFFFIGFIATSYLDINLLGVGLIALISAFLFSEIINRKKV